MITDSRRNALIHFYVFFFFFILYLFTFFSKNKEERTSKKKEFRESSNHLTHYIYIYFDSPGCSYLFCSFYSAVTSYLFPWNTCIFELTDFLRALLERVENANELH